MRSSVVAVGLLVLLLGMSCEAPQHGGEKDAPPALASKNNQKHHPLEGNQGEVVAIVFTSVDCPVANAMAPQLRRIYEESEERGIRCYLVYPRAGTSDEAMAAHVAAYDLPGIRIADSQHALVELLDAKTTPEAYVLQFTGPSSWIIRYQGRVNDLYSSIGNRRDLPSTHDFRDAIVATSDGGSIETPYPPAVGCFIERRN